MFAVGSSAGIVKIGSGSIAGLTQAAPQSIDFRNFTAAGAFNAFELQIENVASSANMTAGADIALRLMVAGVAQATNYSIKLIGDVTTSTGVPSATSVNLIENGGIGQVQDGFAVINLRRMFENKKPCGAVWGFLRQSDGGGNLTGAGGWTFMRDAAAVHDGIQFIVTQADVDTYSFDWQLRGIK